MTKTVSTSLEENITYLKETFPLGISFDLITRELFLGKTKAFWMGINGFCKVEILQQIFSDLQNPLYTQDATVENIALYINSKLGYAQTTLSSDWKEITRNLLSGPSVLFIDGFNQAVILDVRTYPTRSVEEPDTEKVTRGSRDGFVETLLFNTNLIRRRIRSPKLTFEIKNIGTASQTDVAISYVGDLVDTNLLNQVKNALNKLSVTSLTMGVKSLEELLVKKSWFHPLPSIQITERPDVACSYLMEGYILLIVDNSPAVIILPCNMFQFTQSPEDYYKSPIVGGYFRLVRFGCIFISLILMPLLLLIGGYFPDFAARWHIFSSELTRVELFFYVLAVEFLLDLFKYSTSLSSGNFSSSLSIVGGLIIGDVAVSLNWASIEVLFYAAITMLTSLSLASMEFSDGIKVYRLFLIVATGFLGFPGFLAGLLLIILSVATTPTFGRFSYLWPLIPFRWCALKKLLFRSPTTKSQPSTTWQRDLKG